jgi:hypothetical protein
MNSRRERSCWHYYWSERSDGRTGTDELMWCSLVESGVVDVDWLKLLAGGPYFILLALGWVRASWRRSWSCVCWLASACIGWPRAAVYEFCLHSLRGVCWPRSMFVCSTVSEGLSPSVWLLEVPKSPPRGDGRSEIGASGEMHVVTRVCSCGGVAGGGVAGVFAAGGLKLLPQSVTLRV